MKNIQLGISEEKFADIIWENGEMKTVELVEKAREELEWKKTTSYTVLKRLCDKGVLVNESGIVRALFPKNQFYSIQSTQFVDQTFQGSLPAFVAAFTSGRKLSQKEINEIERMIREAKE